MFVERVHSLPSVSSYEVQNSQHGEVQVTYGNKEDFETFSKHFGLMSDTKVWVCVVWYVCCVVCVLCVYLCVVCVVFVCCVCVVCACIHCICVCVCVCVCVCAFVVLHGHFDHSSFLI